MTAFKDLPDPEEGFGAIPLGEYLAKCISVDDTKTTKDGSRRWNLEFVVAEGEYTGKHFWDDLFFTEKAQGRIKLVGTRMGISKDLDRELLPADLIGKLVWVTLEQEEGFSGVLRNKIPFAGYRRYVPEDPGQGKTFEVQKEEGVPF